MNLDWFSAWAALALLIAFFLGMLLSRYVFNRLNRSNNEVNQEYFKGLNFILNEEPDKAIEAFIKALEVDTETVELHLALGGLFRRKGQVDRATRIHQNLIARPSLTESQRIQAIYELAQDYYKAGLLDRAEGLFIELKESPSHRRQALEGLREIYQQEKEWKQAIDVCKAHKRGDRQEYLSRVAHYWCELADNAMSEGEFEEAKKYLREALSEDRSLARAVLLRGKLHYLQNEYKRALTLWESLYDSHPYVVSLVIDKIVRSYGETNNQEGLKNYLLGSAPIPRNKEDFNVWLEALTNCFGTDHAHQHILEKVNSDGLSAQVAKYLIDHIDSEFSNNQQNSLNDLAISLLSRVKNRNIEFTCLHCGFGMRQHYWLCQNCGEWDSFRV